MVKQKTLLGSGQHTAISRQQTYRVAPASMKFCVFYALFEHMFDRSNNKILFKFALNIIK